MKKYNLLHISPTPLVGSPIKINKLCKNHFNNSNVIIFNDYPGKLKGLFSGEAIEFNKKTEELCIKLIQEADIIHIHNFLTEEQENLILKNSKDEVIFIYQVHSPLREGPIFVKYYKGSKIPFQKKLVVGQYQPRLYKDFEFVPNIVLKKPSINLIKEDEKPIIIFSPSHRRDGKWNKKLSEKLEKILLYLRNLNLIHLIIAEGLKPEILFAYRKKAHISIDEIVTGSFHQVSLEGLCAGNVVINNSDIFTNIVLENIVNTKESVPFYKLNEYNIEDKLLYLINNKELIREYQIKSYKFYNKYLLPEKLILKYINIYKELLNIN